PCIEFREEHPPTTTSYCAPAGVVDAALMKEHMTPQVEFSETTSWLYGWASASVANVRAQVGGSTVGSATPAAVSGTPWRMFWAQISPRPPKIPVVIALDGDGHVLARALHPGVGGCEGCVPPAGTTP
ncbi:MAG: hypothetical protein LC663_01525, partial [Actinobacteria bacterium]|nr:hypothetical protein [Actinomycetota bacterium]